MNLAEKAGQPTNPQDDYRNLFIGINQSLNRLHVSLIGMFSRTFLQTSSSIEYERSSRLDRENPKEQELQTVSIIFKRLKEKLQEESFHGREILTLLKEVFSHLWTYLLLNQGTQRPIPSRYFTFNPTRQCHDQESSNYRRISDDCEAVIQTIQQSEGVCQNELYERCSTLNEALNRILCYLKQTMTRQSQSQMTSYDGDKVFEELDWILR